MKCATPGCSQEARRECIECSRHYCDRHVEWCELCQANVCLDCREEHQSNPQHEGESRNA